MTLYLLNKSTVVTKTAYIFKYSRTPLIRTLVIQIANCADRLGPSVKSVENSTELSCLEITSYRIKCQYIIMASRTSNQAWSKGLDSGK